MHLVIFTHQHLPNSILQILKEVEISYKVVTTTKDLSKQLQEQMVKTVLTYRVSSQEVGLIRFIIGGRAKLLVISSNNSLLERFNALRSGIQGYYIEPFAHARFVFDLAQNQPAEYRLERLEIGHLSVDTESSQVIFKGEPVKLSRKQYLLLRLLANHLNEVVSRSTIWHNLWGSIPLPPSNTVDALVRRLRLSLRPEMGISIKSVQGVGYKLVLNNP